MIYIYQNANCISIVYEESSLTEQEKMKGIALEQLPDPEVKEGKIAVLKIDKEKNKVWYEYVEDTKIKEIAKLEALQRELEQCKQSVVELTALANTVTVPKV